MHNTSLILYNDTRIGTGLVDIGTHGSSNQKRPESRKEEGGY